MPHPTSDSAYGIWSLNEIRDAVRGDNWPGPAIDPSTLQPLGDSSCVRFYQFEDNVTESIANDTSASIVDSLSYVTGKVSKAIAGGYSSGYVSIPAYSGGTSGSYTFWIYAGSSLPDNTLWTVLSDSNTGNNIVLRSTTSGFVVRQSNGNESTVQSFDQWIHVTFIRTTATTCTVYFNGANPENLTGARDDSDQYIRIGSNQLNFGDFALDHLRFFNKQLTAQEVLTVYNIDNG